MEYNSNSTYNLTVRNLMLLVNRDGSVFRDCPEALKVDSVPEARSGAVVLHNDIMLP